jgi:hypothetical protein
MGHAADEAVLAEPAQVVGHLSWCDLARMLAEQGCDDAAKVAVGEPVGLQPVDADGLQEGVDALVAEAEPGGAGAVVVDDRA